MIDAAIEHMCKSCGRSVQLIPGRRQREFCNPTCRQRYHRAKQKSSQQHDQAQIIEELRAENADLRARVVELEQLVAARPAKKKQREPLPDALTEWRGFALLHGVRLNSVETLMKSGAIHAVRGKWIMAQGRIDEALDERGRFDFWVQLHEEPGFRACDECPHIVTLR